MRFILTAAAVCVLYGLRGQSVGNLPAEEFRAAMRAAVSAGNREYDLSRRHGIRMMADSAERMLLSRSRAGRLNRTDSLEFTADVLKLRGDFHYEHGHYDSVSYRLAERFFLDALNIYTANSEFYGHLQCAPMIHRELAQLYYKTGDYQAARAHISEALEAWSAAFENGEFDVYEREYEDYLDIMAQTAICNARIGNSDRALAQIDSVIGAWPADSERRSEALRKRGKILMIAGGKGCAAAALPFYKEYMQRSRAEAVAIFAGMNADERESWWMRMRPFFADCYQTEDADPAFLYDATLFSKGLLLQLNRMSGRDRASREALNTLQYTWRDIQGRLAEDACAIEFVQYEKSGKQLTAALVLKRNGRPLWVPVMSAEEFESYCVDGRANGERLNSVSGAVKNAMFRDPELRRRIWNDTLREVVGSCRKIYFSPDGYLHRLPIEYMLPDDWSERDLYRLTSTRRLMENQRIDSEAALIVGGIRYGGSDGGGMKVANDSAAFGYMRSMAGAGFDYLPYSRIESDSIYLIRSCPRDTLLTGTAATEPAFRELCGSYPIVTISTHGFLGGASVPQGSDLKPCLCDETLSQSVIVLAGANRSVEDAGFDGNAADGFLSAREIAETDMSGVDMAVLSACQTGLGYVTADGIYGIQRGLKIAGVGCMLVSLWNVDDRATCIMMTEFHRNLHDGMTPHEAFRAARYALVRRSRSDSHRRVFNPATLAAAVVNDDGEYAKPQYCNAFVMIDAIE